MSKGYQCDMCGQFFPGRESLSIRLSTEDQDIAYFIADSLVTLDACNDCAKKLISGLPGARRLIK